MFKPDRLRMGVVRQTRLVEPSKERFFEDLMRNLLLSCEDANPFVRVRSQRPWTVRPPRTKHEVLISSTMPHIKGSMQGSSNAAPVARDPRPVRLSETSQRVQVPNVYKVSGSKNHTVHGLGSETLKIGYLDPPGIRQ